MSLGGGALRGGAAGPTRMETFGGHVRHREKFAEHEEVEAWLET
jgi:hypothetical protein